MGDFSIQADRYRALALRDRDRTSVAVREYHDAGGAKLDGDNPEKARILKEALDRAEAEMDRIAGRYMNAATVLEYDEAIAGSDIIREIEGK